jgi:hypothetical protein
MAKKNLKYDAKKVVICQIIGKLKIPNSPNSIVKKPKKLIFIDDNIKTVNGKINETKINTLLVLLNNSFCNSKLKSLSMRLVLMD